MWIEWTWWALALTPVVWILQNILHEGSHLWMAMEHYGLMPKALIPYPHKHGGKWHFSRCTFEEPEGPIPVVDIAPLVMSVVYGLAVAAIMIFMASPFQRSFFLVIVAAPVVDALFWVRGYFWGSPSCDGKAFRAAMKGRRR